MTTTRVEKEFLRKKLEEVYLDGIRFQNMLLEIALVYLDYQKNQITSEAGKTKLSQYTPQEMVDTTNKLVMHCNIYFPELTSDLNAIIAVRNRISHHGYAPLHIGRQSEHVLEQLSKDFHDQLQANDAFNKAVFALGRSLNSPTWFWRR